MEVLGKKHVMTVVRTILQQLAGTTEVNVFSSWGVSKMYGTQIVMPVNGMDFAMAVLVMQVNGFNFKGKLYIALDEGSDYYRIFLEKNGKLIEEKHDIGFEELGGILDDLIETGGLTKEEYHKKVLAMYHIDD
nr:hypothetical protein [uncultured Prevotella sp.]